MSRVFTAALLGLGIVFGAIAWGLAIPDEYRIVYGVVPVVGIAVCVLALARLRERGGLPRHGAARLLLYCLLVGVLVHVGCFSPFVAPRAFLVLHLALVGGAWYLIWRGRRAPGASALPLMSDVLIAGCLILVVGSELTLRFWAWYEPRSLFLQRDMAPAARIAAVRFEPGAIVDGSPVNQDGFRDAVFEHREGNSTVMVLGDRAFALGVPAAFAPTAVATAASSSTVFWNATLPNTGPLEAEELLRRLASSARPDAVVHVLSLGDDLVDLQRTPPPWTPLALWLDRENVLSTLIVARVLARMEENLRLGDKADPPLSERIEARDQLRARLPWLDDPQRELPRMSAESISEHMHCTVEAHAGAKGRALAELAVDIEARMAAAAGQRGIAFGVLILPARFQIDDDAWGKLGTNADRDAPRAALLQGLRAHDIPTQDLAVLFSAIPAAGGGRDHIYHSGDLALGVEGARLAGDALVVLARQLLHKGGEKR